MTFKSIAAALLIGASPFAHATDLIPVGYTYPHPFDGGYADSTGQELTDGITFSQCWDGVSIITFATVAPLVGWQVNDPSITFDFGTPVNVGSVLIYFADSNGAAGVGMPSFVNISTPGGFNQTFPVIDPPGLGTTVPVLISGLNLSTDTVTVTANRNAGFSWTMLSEVSFATPVPEPSAYALGFGVVALGVMAVRRRR